MSTNIKVQRICQHCGKEFTAKTTVTKFCSHLCTTRNYKARKKAEKVEASNQETQSIIAQPVEQLKSKAYLSIADASKLVGISRRTLYRMMERNELNFAKMGRRTIIRRADIDQLFELPSLPQQNLPQQQPIQYDVAECYTITEVQNKYGISEGALQQAIKRNNVPKVKEGRYTYVPKTIIDTLLS